MKNGLMRKLTAFAIAAVLAFTAAACDTGDGDETQTTTTTTTAPAETEDETDETETTEDETEASTDEESEPTETETEDTESEDTTEGSTEPAAADVPADRYDATTEARTGANASQPLVLQTGTLDGRFSPFFYTSAYDNDVISMTSLGLLSTTKDGEPVAGVDVPSIAMSYDIEVADDESQSKYTFVLKNGLTFSDGTPLTVQDVLFSFYVYNDPLYDGIATLYSLDVPGLSEYRYQTSTEQLEKTAAILEAGISGDADSGVVYGDVEAPATAEEQETYWSYLDEAGTLFAQDIVDYVVANYGTNAGYVGGFFGAEEADVQATIDEMAEDEDMQVMYGMGMWGFGEYADGVFTDSIGNTYTLGEDTITAEDYWANLVDAYGYNLDDEEGLNYEATGDTMVEDYVQQLYMANEGAVAGGVSTIEGVTSGTVVGDDGVERETFEVIINGVDPTAIFKLGMTVSPMHHYTDGYTGELNENGVDVNVREFMDHLKTRNSHPLGAGPYIFETYENNIVTYTANDNYLLGSPRIQTIRYQEIAGGSEMDSLLTSTVHFANPSAQTELINQITEGAGDYAAMDYALVDNDGYGYIGIQGQAIPEFEVRQAIAHATNPELSISDYYGELASVNYRTMTKVQWAYPDNPEPIYPYDETGETSKALFLEAGYAYDEASNVMSYPEGHDRAGEQVTFKFTLPSASEDHPAGVIFLDTQQVLGDIGVIVEIEVDSNLLGKLSTAYESGIQVWAAAWGSGGVDPDMFQIWYSDPAVNKGTSPARSGMYYLFENGTEEEQAMLTRLNELITAGRTSLDQEERKVIYEEALELSTGIAVEIPTYQRKNMFAFNSEVINVDTLFTGEDVTPFQSPIAFIWNVELNG